MEKVKRKELDMAKLRKMLGKIEDPSVIGLQRLIETQSKNTLALWAVGYVEKYCLPIYEKSFPAENCFRAAMAACREFTDGAKKLAEVKPFLKEAAQAAREVTEPAQQAAARAMATACAVVQTPTNALGFGFYTVAAIVYDRDGLKESPEFYDEMAAQEFAKILDSLKEAAVEDEPNPVKVNWGC